MSERFDDFELLVTCGDAGACVGISGDIDLASAPTLGDALAAVSETVRGDVAVDLSRTGFCDSVGLHALLAAQQELEQAGRTMRLINPPTCVLRLLELTATSDLFHVVMEAGAAGDTDTR